MITSVAVSASMTEDGGDRQRRIGLNDKQDHASGARGLSGAFPNIARIQNAEVELSDIDQITLVFTAWRMPPRSRVWAKLRSTILPRLRMACFVLQRSGGTGSPGHSQRQNEADAT